MLKSYNKRSHIHMPKSLSARMSDKVVTGMGSWKFIFIQSLIVACWILLNIIGFVGHWDTYPFILLNLMFSTQAAYASPLILMASNRSAAKDRVRDDSEAEEVEQLLKIQHVQLDLLREVRSLSQELHQHILKSQDQEKG